MTFHEIKFSWHLNSTNLSIQNSFLNHFTNIMTLGSKGSAEGRGTRVAECTFLSQIESIGFLEC